MIVLCSSNTAICTEYSVITNLRYLFVGRESEVHIRGSAVLSISPGADVIGKLCAKECNEPCRFEVFSHLQLDGRIRTGAE